MDPLRALVLVCTLKKTPSASSSHMIAKQVMDALREGASKARSSGSSTTT